MFKEGIKIRDIILDDPLFVMLFGTMAFYVNRITSLLTMNHKFFANAVVRSINAITRDDYAVERFRQRFSVDYDHPNSSGYEIASRYVILNTSTTPPRTSQKNVTHLYYINSTSSENPAPDLTFYRETINLQPEGPALYMLLLVSKLFM